MRASPPIAIAARPIETKFHDQPAPKRDALRPGESERAALELAGDEGRAEEDPDERGRDRDDERQGSPPQEQVVLEHRVSRRSASSSGRAARAGRRRSPGRGAGPVTASTIGEHGEQPEADDRLGAELAQRQADHGRTSTFGWRFPCLAPFM